MKRRKLLNLLIGSVLTIAATSCSTKTTVNGVKASDRALASSAVVTTRPELPICSGWQNAIFTDNPKDIPTIEGLGYKATYCSLQTSENDQPMSEPTVLVELDSPQVSQNVDPQKFEAEQTKIQDAAIARLKGVGITARPGGVG